MLLIAAALHLAVQSPINIKPPDERFQLEAPLTSVSGLMMDDYNDGMGLAQQWARAQHLQARIMWIDGTANLDRVNTEDKIAALTKKIAEVGFNTIVFDIKPISGQVLYNSAIAPKIESWRGQTLPKDFDPLPIMVREAHRNGLMLLTSMNAFSEGHSLFKVGPGYAMKDHQSVLYVPLPTLVSNVRWADIDPTPNSDVLKNDKIHVITDISTQRDLGPSGTDAVLDPNGKVVAISDMGVPTGFKKGDTLLSAIGEGGQFLRDNLIVGQQVQFGSCPTFPSTSDHPDQYPLMMNPNDPDVQNRMLSIVHEVVSKYGVDGVLFDDRLRFAGMNADFSPLSRSLFEKYLGQKVNWPDDVFQYTYSTTLHKGLKPGKFFDAWMLWRAQQMRNWVLSVRKTVNAARPGVLFGIYGGSWYGEYPEFGSNYGSTSLEAGFEFLTPSYQKTGFARLLDFLITGCYYGTPTIYQAMTEGKPVGSTVEAAGQLSNRVTDDQCWTVAGIALDGFAGDPTGLQNALQAACASTQGVMVFDLSHNIEPMWPAFAAAFHFPAKTPFSAPAVLARVRGLRKRYQDLGVPERPVVISTGTSGTGF